MSRFNSLRHKGRETESEHYAIYNDDALNHRLLTYFIRVPQQIRQLRDIGFEAIKAFGGRGERLNDDAVYDEGPMVYYMAEKS